MLSAIAEALAARRARVGSLVGGGGGGGGGGGRGSGGSGVGGGAGLKWAATATAAAPAPGSFMSSSSSSSAWASDRPEDGGPTAAAVGGRIADDGGGGGDPAPAAAAAARTTTARRTLLTPPSRPRTGGRGTVTDRRWTGRLVARVLPREYEEYGIRKPESQFDPSELVRVAGRTRDGGGDGGRDDSAPGLGDGWWAPSDGGGDEGLVVTLDLFLFRRYVPPSVPLQHASHSDSFKSSKSFVSSGSLKSDGGGGGGRIAGGSPPPSSDSDREEGAAEPTPPTPTDDAVLHMHLKREATESASRTLRRLEISAAKKMQSAIPVAGRGKRARKRRPPPPRGGGGGVQRTTAARGAPSPASSVVVRTRAGDGWGQTDDDDDDGDDDAGPAEEMDVTGMNSADLWRRIATDYDRDPERRGRAGVALADPDHDPDPTGWNDGGGNRIYLDVVSCPPTVLSVRTFEDFSAQVFTGVPLVVETELIFASRAVVTWYVDGEVVLHDDGCFTPSEDDVGKEVCVLIVPVRLGHDGRGCEEAYRYRRRVEKLPFMPIVSPIRDAWRRRTPAGLDDLRVLTYNILADLYTSRDIDQHLMYSHCDLRHLMRWRRMPMLIYEILAYRADVICLQEVDALIYDTLLRPVLGARGYQGFYSNKASTQREGCAVFWSLECFEAASERDMHTFSIRDLFGDRDREGEGEGTQETNEERKRLTKWDSMDEIMHLMGKHDELRRVTREKVGQILQAVTLTLKKRRDGALNGNVHRKPDKMILANTHLFYHPLADHVRAMQAYVVCKKIDELRRRDGGHPYPLILCGDLNSNPLSGAVQLLFTRALLPEHYETWKHLHDYVWEMGDNEYMIEHGYIGNETTVEEPTWEDEAFDDAHEDEVSLAEEESTGDSAIHPPPIVLPPAFPNLVSGVPDMPRFTNYAVDFVETLDYVLASEASELERFGFGPKTAAPMPSEEEVKRYVAMPNEFMPSDHVSVVCDLEWRINEKVSGNATDAH